MISYNIHKDSNGLKDHLRRLAPNVVLVLANYGLAHDIAVQEPNTQVIFRPYYGRDDLYNFMSANQFIADCRNWWQGEPNIWFHTNNEAGMSPEMARWEMSLLSAPAGLKFVVGNPATGTFPDSAEGWSYLRDYIKFLVDHSDRFMLGLHEYFDVTPVITMPQWLQRITSWAGLTQPSYHVGRYRWLIEFCDVYLAGKYPKIVITEAGNDDLTEGRAGSDVNQFLSTLGFKPRGWRTLQQLWTGWYSRQADITYYKMFEWLVANVYNHPAIVGLCIFAWTEDNAPQWGMFNVSTATNFRNLNEAGRAVQPEPLELAMVVSNYITNVRETASTLSKIVGKLKYGTMFWVSKKMSGDWYRIEVDGVRGFVRKDVIEFTTGLNVVSVAKYNVIVREQPSLVGKQIGKVLAGQSFVVYGTIGDWVVVRVGNLLGFSNSAVLDYRETP